VAMEITIAIFALYSPKRNYNYGCNV
jgi:hypothetical protein